MSATVVAGKKHIGTDLTQGPILKGLLLFALPMVMTSIIQQLYSLVDMIVIGQFVGSTGTVGVSLGSEIADLVTPIATAFSNAGQIYIAQLAGAKMEGKIKKGIGTLITMLLFLSVCFMFLTLISCRIILQLMNCPAAAMHQAETYMLITALGMPFIFGYNAICAILRAMGESKRPLLFIIVAAVTNIFLDILLVVFFRMEAAGTAIATVMAQMGAFLAALVYLYRHREQTGFEIKLSYLKIDREAAKIIVMQGLPQAIRSMCVRFSILWVNSHINAYGLVASATNSVGNKLLGYLDVFSYSVTQASGAMVGQNLGAGKKERAAKTIWCTLGCTVTTAVILSGISLAIPRQLFGILSSDPEVLDMGVIYMQIMVWHYLCSAITMSFQSMVIGSGFASMNFAVGILDGVVCKIGFSILFTSVFHMEVLGYFWATAISRALPGLICACFFLSGKWKTRRLLTGA